MALAKGAGAASSGKAKSCILIYLLGGPPHLDMWDLKPEAPVEVRGPFKPIAARVPGLRICEHFPKLATIADQYSVLRAVSHPNSNHTPMIYYTLTGRHVAQPGVDNDVSPPSRSDFPHVGSITSKFLGGQSSLPRFVAIPEVAVRSNEDNIRPAVPLRGGRAGFLGTQCDPLIVNGDPRQAGSLSDLLLPEGINAERFARREALLGVLGGTAGKSSAVENFSALRQMAVHLTGSEEIARLFSVQGEPDPLRQRYGTHRFGQSLLLARRLAEAEVPMIAIHFNHMTRCDGWDTHGKNFEACQQELLPLVDQGLSALIEDLGQRGLLEQTIVACYGEFGRTPIINGNAGRDHWGPCSTTLLAGGGIQGGILWGESDKIGAYPKSDAVDPVDIQATIYHCLGLSPELLIHDQFSRPMAISTGRVLHELL